MNRPTLCALALGLSLCLAAPAPAQETAPATRPLKFGWAVPSKATVTQVGLKKGKRATLRYSIALTAAGDELRLSFGDLEILSANGRDMTTPEMKVAMAPQVANLSASFPDLRISKSGVFLGIVDWEGHVKRCIAALRAVMPKPDEAGLERTRKTMMDPRYQKMLEAKGGESWQVWVGAWVDGGIDSGESLEGVSQLPIGNELIDAKLTFTHEGDGGEGDIRLSLKTVLDGEEAKAALVKLMRGMAGMPEETKVDAFEKVTVIKVVTNPKTLRPRSASSESRNLVSVDGKTQRELETRSYTFEWKE